MPTGWGVSLLDRPAETGTHFRIVNKRRSSSGPWHSEFSARIEHTMDEIIDRKLNDRMDEYEQVSKTSLSLR